MMPYQAPPPTNSKQDTEPRINHNHKGVSYSKSLTVIEFNQNIQMGATTPRQNYKVHY